MKLSLTVLTAGKMAGKTLPITLSQFLIGRDAGCQLRPASPQISKRHCALLIRDTKVFVRDFGSTNGTFLNDQRIEGECELTNNDRLTVGPLAFRVNIGTPVSIDQPTPLPGPLPLPEPKPAAEASEEDKIAAMMMFLDKGVPSTGVEISAEATTELDLPLGIPTPAPSGKSKPEDVLKEPGYGDTGAAARAILKKYKLRPREERHQ